MQEPGSLPQCKVEQKRAAKEIKQRLKQAQKQLWEEGRQEHLQRPAERGKILEEAN